MNGSSVSFCVLTRLTEDSRVVGSLVKQITRSIHPTADPGADTPTPVLLWISRPGCPIDPGSTGNKRLDVEFTDHASTQCWGQYWVR